MTFCAGVEPSGAAREDGPWKDTSRYSPGGFKSKNMNSSEVH